MQARTHGAFISARYSTDNQNPDSIDVQVEQCRKWCAQNNVPVLGVFADEAVSGMKTSRPQYDAMMARLRQGEADMVVIYDQSRAFRRMTSWFTFRDELSAMSVQVISVTQPMIGKDLRDPTNFLTEGSMALFNQIWALQSRQKVIEKMRHMARNGQHTGGQPPLGYIVEDGKLEICPEEAKIVRRIFAEYLAGGSYKSIIEGLNRDGIKTKRGNSFGANSLHDLLHNEKYVGVLVYGKSEHREDGTRNTHYSAPDAVRIADAVPAIIDREVFDKVQARMAENKRQQSGRPPKKRDYPLRGKVFCAYCKAAMTISESKGQFQYYGCSRKKRSHNCDNKPISVDFLEKTVAQTVREVLADPQNARNLIRILREEGTAIQSSAAARLKALLHEEEDIKKKLDNAANAILNGLNSQTLLDKVAELEHKKQEIAGRIKALKASVDASLLPEQRLQKIINEVSREDYSDLDILLSIVARVEVSSDTITVWTILDTRPDGTLDYYEPGVMTTLGVPPAPPKRQNPNPLGSDFVLFTPP